MFCHDIVLQINATTFWTIGCAVRDPQLGLRASNSQQEVEHSFASDPERIPREMPLSDVWQPTKALNYALCRYFDVLNQVRLTGRRSFGKYFKTIAVNSSKRALGEKTLAQAESCAVIYEVLGGILCLRRDSAINLFLIFENKVQLGRLSPRAALTSTGAQEDK